MKLVLRAEMSVSINANGIGSKEEGDDAIRSFCSVSFQREYCGEQKGSLICENDIFSR